MSTVTGKSAGLDSWLVLPEWAEEGTEPSLRDNSEEFPSRPVVLSSSQMVSPNISSGTPQMLLRSSTPPSGRASPAGPTASTTGHKRWANLDDFLNEAPLEEEEGSSSEESSSSEGSNEEETQHDNNLGATISRLASQAAIEGPEESEDDADNGDTDSTDGTGSSE